MVFKCCVKGCKTIAKNGLHSFPSNKSIAKKWLMAIKALNLIDLLNEGKLSRSYHKVCKKHFGEKDFQSNIDGKSQLVTNSVPSLYLPDDAVACSVVKNKNSHYSSYIVKCNLFRILHCPFKMHWSR